MSNKNAQILVGGDFNCGDIDWKNLSVSPGASKGQAQRQLVDIVKEHCLTQIVDVPTRLDKTLDILLTNNPTPVNRIKGMPPIGKSDHDIIHIEYDVNAKRIRKTPRKILLYNKADFESLRKHLHDFSERLQSTKIDQASANDIWNNFKDTLLKGIEKFIPSKMSKSKVGYPWIDLEIKRLIRKREKLFHKARKSKDPSTQKHYKNFRAMVQKKIRDAYWKHVSNIFTLSDDDADIQKDVSKPKKFWSFVKSLKRDSSGIATLRENGFLRSDSKEKANILNRQFQSVFTKEADTDPPSKGQSPHNSMQDFTIDKHGVKKLLDKLNVNKATGPDNISARVLKECSEEISAILEVIFNKSLEQSSVPDDWKQANVVPIFKKGEKYNPANYRPVSLTCICSKLLEHILVSNIMRHLMEYNILVDAQHGFRSKRSCDTQLVQFIHDLTQNMDSAFNKKHKQTDVIIMDFAKAFDKVPHRRLIDKLEYYGIRGYTSKWIASWLNGRTQKVVLDGIISNSTDVISGVPQGSVLGPILFLIFINDLPEGITSSVRLFADDCVLYRNIRSMRDCQTLQDDIDLLAVWESNWLMEFNVGKCNSMMISRQHPDRLFNFNYHLHGQTLESVTSAKYLGVTITSNLDWGLHTKNICSKATQTLGFIRRNLALAPRATKGLAYQTLVRPKLEYASPVWSPHQQKDIHKIEMVQRTAARWTCRRWRNTSHVGEMLSELEWPTLEHRRDISSLSFFYKIHHNTVSIDTDTYLQPVLNARQTRSNHPFQYRRPMAYSDALKNSFFPRTIHKWNNLPLAAVSASTVEGFQTLI